MWAPNSFPEILDLLPVVLEVRISESDISSVDFSQASLGLLELLGLADRCQPAPKLEHGCESAPNEVDHAIFRQLTSPHVVLLLYAA
jgi:hypothetical protein